MMNRRRLAAAPALFALVVLGLLAGALFVAPAGAAPEREAEHYQMIQLPIPENLVLEVGGILPMKDGKLLVATRRGEVYLVSNAFSNPPKPTYTRWAFGLSEPLGLCELDGWVYTAQRGELTRMKDSDGDGKADRFETVCDAWQISGNYHEYAFGPTLDREGYLWVTLNKPFGDEPWGRAHWRGWAVRVDPRTGKMHPMCNGLRSPAGVQAAPWGDVFYTDNQGEWCNASKFAHLEAGDFHGHPHGLPSTELPDNPIKGPKPRDIPDGMYMKDLKQKVPSFKMPAVWLPYDKMGNSPSGMAWDTSGGKFGPFHGQCFVGDQHHAWVMRLHLEKVGGHWQGAGFPFREGFATGLIRLNFGKDDSGVPTLFCGGSNRGWGSRGNKPWNLERLVYTGKTPFEIKTLSARHDGFVLQLTKPVDADSARQASAYKMQSYTYRLRGAYGGPEEDVAQHSFKAIEVSADGMTVRLRINPMRAGYVHELDAAGLRSAEGASLLHTKAYYTLVNLPGENEEPVMPVVPVQ